MNLRYLVGPVTAEPARCWHLHRQHGLCLAFNADGSADIKVGQCDRQGNGGTGRGGLSSGGGEDRPAEGTDADMGTPAGNGHQPCGRTPGTTSCVAVSHASSDYCERQ
jgi:hypothetical protein